MKVRRREKKRAEKDREAACKISTGRKWQKITCGYRSAPPPEDKKGCECLDFFRPKRCADKRSRYLDAPLCKTSLKSSAVDTEVKCLPPPSSELAAILAYYPKCSAAAYLVLMGVNHKQNHDCR